MVVIVYCYTVPLKCDVVLQECEQLKTLIKGCGTHFAHDYSSQTKWDEYSQAKWVPRPLINEYFNHSHPLEMILHLGGTIYVTISVPPPPQVRTSSEFLLIFSALSSPRNALPKFQPIVVSSFGNIVLNNRKSNEIDLYSNYAGNKL